MPGLDPYDFAELDGWADSWKFTPADLAPGRQLVDVIFKPFLFHLADSGLSRRTLRRHIDSAWVLGGEFIRYIHEDPRLRRKPEKVLREFIERGAGPALLHGDGNVQRDADVTFRALARFLRTRVGEARSQRP